ncbi:hypothetical protein [Azospirillum sp.]|uniref:hypothetical protein n=1 Tax=Azospirillum sp. TaxID=34012 RepID=UPI003D73A266
MLIDGFFDGLIERVATRSGKALDRSQAMAWLEFCGRHGALTGLFGDEVEDA